MQALIANSEAPFVELLCNHLHSRGDEAEIANNGLECISLLRRLDPDVLILDTKLLWGGSDGVLAQMCYDTELRQIPVIQLADEVGESNP